MRVTVFRVVLLGASVTGSLATLPAFADAVPPPPMLCLPGEVGVTSHRGPACVPKAPTDCAPGYRGELGGRCVLAACSSDNECDAGRRCLQVDACQELRELHWTGLGWSPYESSGRASRLATRPQPAGPPPQAWIKLHICGQDGACNTPRKCRPAGLCYPPTDGDPKAKVVAAAPSAEPLPAGVYPQDLVASPPSTAGTSACRRGCAVSSTSNVVSWLALPTLAALALWRRRRVSAVSTIAVDDVSRRQAGS